METTGEGWGTAGADWTGEYGDRPGDYGDGRDTKGKPGKDWG